MKTFSTSATVEANGTVGLSGVPFATGTEVEITVCPKRPSAEAFRAAWMRVCRELRVRTQNQNLTDDDIQTEIDAYRAER